MAKWSNDQPQLWKPHREKGGTFKRRGKVTPKPWGAQNHPLPSWILLNAGLVKNKKCYMMLQCPINFLPVRKGLKIASNVCCWIIYQQIRCG